MADDLRPILLPDGASPRTYVVDGPVVVQPYSAYASFDGAGASASWLAALTIRSRDGQILARLFPTTELAVGDTADVTYAPFLGAASAGGGGLETTNGTLDIDPTHVLSVADGLLLTQPATGTAELEVDPAFISPYGGGPGGDNVFLALGFKAINGDPRLYPGTAAWVSGDIVGTAVWLPAGRQINSLGFYQNNGGFVVTLARLAIYDSAGNLVASTANTTTLPSNTGWRTASLSSAYTPSSSGLYYFAALMVGAGLGSYGTIRASIAGQTDIGHSPATGTPAITFVQSGQTNLTDPVTMNATQQYMPLLFAL